MKKLLFCLVFSIVGCGGEVLETTDFGADARVLEPTQTYTGPYVPGNPGGGWSPCMTADCNDNIQNKTSLPADVSNLAK